MQFCIFFSSPSPGLWALYPVTKGGVFALAMQYVLNTDAIRRGQAMVILNQVLQPGNCSLWTSAGGRSFECQQKFLRPIYIWACTARPPHTPSFAVQLSFNCRRTLSQYSWRVQCQPCVCSALGVDRTHGCVDGEGARYWRLICGLIGVTEEIKSPCGCRGFGWLGSKNLATREPSNTYQISQYESQITQT